jgi:inner membrane protein
MDSLTHIAIGSCIGEIMLGKKAGKKAILWGLIAASLPDIDAVAGLFLNLPEELIAHRGITHSLLFALLAPLPLTLLCRRLYPRLDIKKPVLYLFFILQILLHDLLDTCNAYGTGLFEPFSPARFSFNTLYVADPLFSIWPIIAAIFVIFLRKHSLLKKRIAATGLITSLLYLCLSINNKFIADRHLQTSFTQHGIKPSGYFITPTPFNTLLWYTVASVDSGYYVAHTSVFDNRSEPVRFNFFEKNEFFLDSVENKEEVKSLRKFADGFYTVEKWNDTLVLNVLRFGQMIGWQEPKAHFAFHYFLNNGYANDLVVQRGRFEGWNKQTLRFMYRRIKGSVEENKKVQELTN